MTRLLHRYSLFTAVCLLSVYITACGVYSFTDASVDPNLKTIRVQPFENRASYQNTLLAPNLTDRLRQKINNQTKLTNTNSDNAHLDVTGYISEYAVSTSGISNRQENMNRLTVAIHFEVNNTLNNEKKTFDVSRNFEFPASSSLQAAENRLLEEMVKNLTDDIFNRMFSNW